MDYIYAIIFGIIQGITEFLPISSSGHLVILHEYIDLPIRDKLTFDIVLHLATLLAVIWFFRKEVLQLLRGWVLSFMGRMNEFSKLSWYVIIATIPAVLAGLFFENLIESVFRSPLVVVVMLIFIGALFIIFEKIFKKTDELSKLNWKKSLLVGLAQVISLIPGTSRSGITIIAGLGTGLKREEAIKFSFLLSIPVIFGASIKKIPDSFGMSFSGDEFTIMLVAFLVSFITGILAIKYFLQFSRRFSLNIFAYYRFALAVLILILLFS